MIEVFPFAIDRRLNGVGGGGGHKDGYLLKVFGFGGLECFGDPLDASLRVQMKFHVFQSCGLGEVERKRC